MPLAIPIHRTPNPDHAPSHRPRIVRVALAGCGTVAGRLLQILQDRAATIEAQHSLRFRVVTVLVRDAARPRDVDVPHELLTTDLEDFLAVDADLVVEAIGGLDPAHRIARSALDRGRGFVTANKALIAAHGEGLAALARDRGTAFACEAAVAGGVPVVRVLRDSLPQTGVQAVQGILNGTTNYILTRMSQGLSFDRALSEAQVAGFAEADPSRDLNGQDAADKIKILAWIGFGTAPGRLHVDRTGVTPDPDRLVADAAAFGGTARLLAACRRVTDGVSAVVEPVVVPPDSAFGRTAAEENLVVVETAASGTIRLSGPGAGGGPTASAVLSDMLGAARPPAPADGPGSTSDPRPLRWGISVVGTDRAGSLLQTAERARIELGDVDVDRDADTTRAVTEPVTRNRVTLLMRALETTGLRPLRLRHGLRADSR